MKNLALVLFTLLICGCSKFLDVKPDQRLEIPDNLNELKLLLRNTNQLNLTGSSMGETMADNYYLTDADYLSLNQEAHRQQYIWGPAPYEGLAFPDDWSNIYQNIYIANTVMDRISLVDIPPSDSSLAAEIKGAALMFRARSLLEATMLWGKAWTEEAGRNDPGVPIRLRADFTEKEERSSVDACLTQVINDLEQAVKILPAMSNPVTDPNRAAAWGLLARCALYKGNIDLALKASDSSLSIYSTLIDFNTLNPAANFPIARFNAETIHFSNGPLQPALSATRAKVDTLLYAQYSQDDLRKAIFFRRNANGSYAFKGSYTGGNTVFTGVSVNETMLIRSECLARLGRVDEAMNALNRLLEKRWRKGTFIPFAANDATSALIQILRERRKELPFRNLRWSDLKRLNRESVHQTTVKRVLDGKEIILPPGDPRYAIAIPGIVINLGGYPQNGR